MFAMLTITLYAVHCFRANKISLFEKKINFRISCQKIIPTTHTKYLRILVDQHLSWDQHFKMMKQKISNTNGLVAKARYYLTPNLRRTLYYSIFESYHWYECQIWGQQKSQHIRDIENLQRRAIKIMHFKSKYSPSNQLFIDSKRMTFPDIIKAENCFLVLQKINIGTLKRTELVQNCWKSTHSSYTSCCQSTDNLTSSQNYKL